MLRTPDVRRRATGIATGLALLVPSLLLAAPAAADGPASQHVTGGTADAVAWKVGPIAGDVSRLSHEAPPTDLVLQEDRVFPQTATDRYEISKGCYALTDASGTELIGTLRMQATDLGTYMFYTDAGSYITGNGSTSGVGTTPGPDAEWLVDEVTGGFTVQHPDSDQILLDDLSLVAAGTDLSNTATGDGVEAVGPPAASIVGIDGAVLGFALDTGCAVHPEHEVNVSGEQPTGDTPYEEVSGYIDAHVHWMAFEFIGGEIRCGTPWHRYGVTVAMVDCPDHSAGGGAGEAFTSGGDKAGQHDTVGWPSYNDWPQSNSLTHEGMYYTGVERAWRGGLRVMVNLLVDNRVLCELFPFTRNPCDETNTLLLEYEASRAIERYIDAQYGGPGRGFLRIAKDPFEARAIINSGRLALINGIETSELFNCRRLAAPVDCTEQHVSDSLDFFQDLGIAQMEFLNKYDNAFMGVTGDGGSTGAVINNGNVFSAGGFWDMETCPDDFNEHQHDKEQANATQIDDGFAPAQDAIFGQIGAAFLPPGSTPVYGNPPHCNSLGLEPIGEYLLDEMAERGILMDPDHVSTRGRQAILDRADAAGYHGVISSHSWSDDSVYERILEMGGIVTPYAGGSEGFVNKWRTHLDWVDDRYVFGFGYGADTNGFGGQGGPRGADIDNPVVYPHTGFGGVTVERNTTGDRTWDVNLDGVDHYGLYADWYQDLRMIGGDAIMADMARGPEAYLQVWERAKGAVVDRCRENTGAPTDPSVLQVGMSSEETVYAFGQPTTRIDDQHTWCIPLSDGTQATVTGFFDAEGHLFAVEGGEPAPAPDPTATETPTAGEQLPATGWNLTSWTFLLMGLSLAGYRSLVRRPSS